jgi:hypothetical protein
MKEATKRSIIRWIHIIFGIPILGYIYDSPSDTPNHASTVRYVFLPVLLLFGAVDVERPRRSTTSFEENENGTRIGGIKIQ